MMLRRVILDTLGKKCIQLGTSAELVQVEQAVRSDPVRSPENDSAVGISQQPSQVYFLHNNRRPNQVIDELCMLANMKIMIPTHPIQRHCMVQTRAYEGMQLSATIFI